jgi:hypothetical protein
MSQMGLIVIELQFQIHPAMDLRSSLLKMEKSYKIKEIRFLLYLLLASFCLILPISSPAKTPEPAVTPLEDEIMKALGKNIRCKKNEVQIRFEKEKPGQMKSLVAKFEGAVIGEMVADHMTVLYENPVIDLNQLKKTKELKILSSSKNKVSILISARAIEGYLAKKATQLQKKYNRISIKFSPPYIECLFDVPASEISPETLSLLKKFVKGAKLEGYAVFQIKAKDNALSALSSKVIVNHFLIPNVILQELQNKFNPFDGIPVLSPFQYSINNINVQTNYLLLTN